MYQYKRPEQPKNSDEKLNDVTIENSSSFKYQSSLLKGLTVRNLAANIDRDIPGAQRLWIGTKIAPPFKYISNFF